MNARHNFILPYTPWPDTHALEIDAQFQREAELREWARRIVEQGPRAALKICLRDAEVVEWSGSAQRYLDCDGDDDGEFADLMDALDVEVNPRGYGLPGHCAGWRGSSYASTWGMGGHDA